MSLNKTSCSPSPFLLKVCQVLSNSHLVGSTMPDARVAKNWHELARSGIAYMLLQAMLMLRKVTPR